RVVGAVRQDAIHVVEVVASQPDLLQVVLALHPVGGLADLLDRGQEQADQDRDDRDDDEQFNQGKRGARSAGGRATNHERLRRYESKKRAWPFGRYEVASQRAVVSAAMRGGCE